ncbi:OLC1v1022904C1 [Oldenlandia corymbosa var. corymbosa]|uniref:OLC1v1022904C1 n=1 Tax=Oldenlandia corymbosa var. corymbosa TaxID=529605 RepID=A0AAV1C0E4_OLDCO|nr:OLC1v1022904C1 [Oldenlandia corymbosa var. corymbosa]
MHRLLAKRMLLGFNNIESLQNPTCILSKIPKTPRRPCEVFINHRGIDTKRTIASLLYDHLVRLGARPFLDNKNMKPGDKLFDKIDDAIKGCKVGVLVFSPRYCESHFCLHELALIIEAKKKVIPIFCDVKPSELVVGPEMNEYVPPDQIERFKSALEEAKFTVGLAFDSTKGNWAEVLTKAGDRVIESLEEVGNHEDDEAVN